MEHHRRDMGGGRAVVRRLRTNSPIAAAAAAAIAGLMLSAAGASASCAAESCRWLVVAQSEWSHPAPEPKAMLRDYWQAIGEAETLGELERFRLGGAPAGEPTPDEAGNRLGVLKDLAARYVIREVETLVSSDAERRLRVRLEPREGAQGVRPRKGEVGIVRTDQGWRIAMEDWREQ